MAQAANGLWMSQIARHLTDASFAGEFWKMMAAAEHLRGEIGPKQQGVRLGAHHLLRVISESSYSLPPIIMLNEIIKAANNSSARGGPPRPRAIRCQRASASAAGELQTRPLLQPNKRKSWATVTMAGARKTGAQNREFPLEQQRQNVSSLASPTGSDVSVRFKNYTKVMVGFSAHELAVRALCGQAFTPPLDPNRRV